MSGRGRRTVITAVLAAALTWAPGGEARAAEVLDYCLDHPDRCAFSVHHPTEGWERHLNADRLQVTASTFKVLTLIVYAHAVVDDWLLSRLGARYFRRVLNCCVDGYHDPPASIAATFLSWGGHPEDPGFGPRMLERYSGQDALGFKQEVTALFQRLQNADFVQASREQACVADAGGFEVELVRSDDAELEAADEVLGGFRLQSLGAGRSKRLKLKAGGLESLRGDYLFVRVDSGSEVGEGVEDNDRPWQVIP